jgi:UPF0271 protein
MTRPAIDLNCDLGEGAGDDAALMPFITSANIACGGHAGDDETMRATVALAQRWGVAVGAHPGYEDHEHFGRRELALSPDEIVRLIVRQVGALQAIASPIHVKPHGALYNQAARDPVVAEAVAEGVRRCGGDLILVGLAGSELVRAGARAGLRVANEAFADRTYRRDGTLTDRRHKDALIADEAASLRQALSLVLDGVVTTLDGTTLALKAETLCLHGDGPRAPALARNLRHGLETAGVAVRSLVR